VSGGRAAGRASKTAGKLAGQLNIAFGCWRLDIPLAQYSHSHFFYLAFGCWLLAVGLF